MLLAGLETAEVTVKVPRPAGHRVVGDVLRPRRVERAAEAQDQHRRLGVEPEPLEVRDGGTIRPRQR